MNLITNSAFETQKIGEELAKEIKQGLVIALNGELGSGKTTFVQGLARGLGVEEKIKSPTFVIAKKYKIPSKKSHPIEENNINLFYHFDCYRISSSRGLKDIELETIIDDAGNVVVIEWAENVENILPKKILLIDFEYIDNKKRRIRFNKKNIKN